MRREHRDRNGALWVRNRDASVNTFLAEVFGKTLDSREVESTINNRRIADSHGIVFGG